MKTIKLTIRVSGYLKEGDLKSFDSDESTVSVECVKLLDETALRFLNDSFVNSGYEALSKYYIKEEDYNRE
jgi:hypothetical protein